MVFKSYKNIKHAFWESHQIIILVCKHSIEIWKLPKVSFWKNFHFRCMLTIDMLLQILFIYVHIPAVFTLISFQLEKMRPNLYQNMNFKKILVHLPKMITNNMYFQQLIGLEFICAIITFEILKITCICKEFPFQLYVDNRYASSDSEFSVLFSLFWVLLFLFHVFTFSYVCSSSASIIVKI